MEFLDQASQRNPGPSEFFDIMAKQLLSCCPFRVETVDERFNVVQILNAVLNSRRNLAPQENITMALHDGLQIELVQTVQGLPELINIGQWCGDYRHRHHKIAGEEHLFFAYVHDTYVRPRAWRMHDVNCLVTQPNYRAFIENNLRQSNLYPQQLGNVFSRLFQSSPPKAHQQVTRRLMRDELSLWKETGSVDVVRMANRIDEVPDPRRTELSGEVNDLPCF